jgi:predicted deacetylase
VTGRYLLRLDDACPTMDARKWKMFENLFDELGIKPLVAVVPDNCDPELRCASPDALFWDKVRAWQGKGWTVAMHGYQHRMHPTKSKLVLPFYEHSEFAGLSYESQVEKIRKSWALFAEKGIAPTAWVAPAHCFDRLTLKAIRNETPIKIVSDGIACDQYFEDGFFWLPQQLWTLSEKSSGLWTVCLHPNTMTENQFAAFRTALEERYISRVTSVDKLVFHKRSKSLADRAYDVYFWQRHRAFKLIHQVRSNFRPA